MTNTRYLSGTRAALLADLASAGFHFTNEDGNTRIPEPFEFASNGKDACIYLGKIPAPLDEEGNILVPESSKYCANVTACEGLTFDTEIEAPTTPYNIFA
jgi:hypothetical protein